MGASNSGGATIPSGTAAGRHKSRLAGALALTTSFMAAEVVGGILTGSLALLADAAHMLTDAGGLALALIAVRFAERPATPQKTYGYVRMEVLSALTNAVVLLLLTVYIPAALLAFGQGVLITTLPLYVSSLGVSYGTVSLVVGASALGTLVTDIPAGALVGRLGLRPTMLVGTCMVGSGTLLLAFVEDIPLMVAARIAAGIGTALWGLSRHAFVASAVPVASCSGETGPV